jgi:adenosylcobinamide-phosphate synthase
VGEPGVRVASVPAAASGIVMCVAPPRRVAMLPEAWIVLVALAVEALVGYPAWLHARIPHPVVWAGNAISALERRWNEPHSSFANRRVLGCLAVVLVVGAAFVVGTLVQWLVGGAIFISIVGTVGLAQRSLFQHVKNVLMALRTGDLAAARERVALIVGRDTRQLDATGVSAAALESLAESFNDGIVAPAFWFFLLGLPGLFAYKALNTADSLIGHKEERWRAFGWAAARADDVANLVPARIAGTLLVLAGWAGLFVMFKDAHKHASPNAGWPEAAMAGALGVRLGGPATYDGVLHERPVFGTGRAPGVTDLAHGLKIYVIACALLWLLLCAGGSSQDVFRWGPTWPL